MTVVSVSGKPVPRPDSFVKKRALEYLELNVLRHHDAVPDPKHDATILDIRKTAFAKGFTTMRYDGVKKVLRGLTTFQEVSLPAPRGGASMMKILHCETAPEPTRLRPSGYAVVALAIPPRGKPRGSLAEASGPRYHGRGMNEALISICT